MNLTRLILALASLGACVQCAIAQETREPYGPFDAIAEGTANSEARRLSLIDSQLDTVDQLRPVTVPVSVRGRRVYYARNPDVAAVYAHGRRGVLGIRPRGYVVVRRAPAVVYGRSSIAAPPLYELEGAYGYDLRDVRQPIGHESLQTGRNRWEYRPLYADDDRLDDIHRGIERELDPQRASYNRDEAQDDAPSVRRRSAARQAAASEPEELPLPADEDPPDAPRRDRGGARDIAREPTTAREDQDAREPVGQDQPGERRRTSVPPPPEPDPPDQPTASARRKSTASDDRAKKPAQPPDANEDIRGPLLPDPSNGPREF